MTAELHVNNLVHHVHSQFALPDYTADDRLANQVSMYFLKIPVWYVIMGVTVSNVKIVQCTIFR